MCWNCSRLLLKALAEEKSFLTFFFLTDKEDVSIQHLHRVTRGIQLDYNILFRWAIKISVATAKQHLLQDIEDIPTYEAARTALRHNCPKFKAKVFNLLYWDAPKAEKSLATGGSWHFGQWDCTPTRLKKKCPLLTDKKINTFFACLVWGTELVTKLGPQLL